MDFPFEEKLFSFLRNSFFLTGKKLFPAGETFGKLRQKETDFVRSVFFFKIACSFYTE